MRQKSRRTVLEVLGTGGLAALSGCQGSLGDSGPSGTATTTDAGTQPPATETATTSLSFPPGTDRSGVVDREALVDAHLSVLAETSYEFGFTVGTPWNRTSMTGRQQDGVDGPRLFTIRSRATQERTDPEYVVERETRTDRWHGPEMPVELEYERTVESTSVSDRSAYETADPDFDLGTTTEFDRLETNSLVTKQRSLFLSLYLGPLTFGSPTPESVGESDAVRFAVTGADESMDTGGIEISGSLVVEPNGRIVYARRTLHRPANNDGSGLQLQTRDVDATNVSGPPAWVEREFGGA